MDFTLYRGMRLDEGTSNASSPVYCLHLRRSPSRSPSTVTHGG